MLLGNPFASAPVQGVPGNVHTPAPPGSVQDNTPGGKGSINDPNNKVQLADDEEYGPDGKTPQKKKATGTGDELGVDFNKLWENEPVDPNKPAPTEDEPYLPKIDPKQLAETISKVDFKKFIKPEQMQAITAGGEAAATAIADIVQQTAQQTLLTAFSSANKLFESGIGNAVKRVDGKIGPRVNETMASLNLSKSNFAAKDPRYAPVVDAIRERIQQKYPKLNATGVEDAVNRMFTGLIELGTKKPGTSQEEDDVTNNKLLKQGSPAADWENWFDSETPKQ